MTTASVTNDEILRAVEAWVDYLARGDYRGAFARIDHDPYYRWTPELIEAVSTGTVFRSLIQVVFASPSPRAMKLADRAFRVDERGDSWTLILEEIHVL